jgi:hypothetical protein
MFPSTFLHKEQREDITARLPAIEIGFLWWGNNGRVRNAPIKIYLKIISKFK